VHITKYTHACVRLEEGGRTLVIDPGIWTEPQALIGADAVLVTHEHIDHIDVLRLAGLRLPVYAPAQATLSGLEHTRGLDLIRVATGDTFEAAGFSIQAVGGAHAIVYGDRSPCANLGYLVDGLYHPGDALHVPDTAVEVLCVPAQASWLKLAEAVDFVNAVRPARALAIHDAQVNERGLSGINHWLGRGTTASYQYVRPGESLD
jgi:L-ascorbate metabolism protein UlaG (beta-lactamase superfamily)